MHNDALFKGIFVQHFLASAIGNGGPTAFTAHLMLRDFETMLHRIMALRGGRKVVQELGSGMGNVRGRLCVVSPSGQGAFV